MIDNQNNSQDANPNNQDKVDKSTNNDNKNSTTPPMSAKKEAALNAKIIKIKAYDRIRRILGFKYFVLAFFWLIFFLLLLTVAILFTVERIRVSDNNNINEILDRISRSNSASEKTDLYQQLIDIRYPIIDFSLLTFLFFTGSLNSKPVSDWSVSWNIRVNNINIAYSYIFISALIAFVGLIFYFIIIIKLYFRSAFEKKYDLHPKYHSGYILFDTRIYLRFIQSLAIVICFFNFLSTLIVLIYGLIILFASYLFWYAFKEKSVILLHRRWWKSSSFVLYFSLGLVQNGYNVLKALFSSQFGVDLDLILSILFPIGTITVVLAILIRNLLSTNVTGVKKAIKNINTRVGAFRIFFYSQKEKSLEDYSFVDQLPILVRRPLQNNMINAREAYDLLVKVNESAIFIEKNFKNENQRNYMLYHLFNEITDVQEIDEIKTNTLKIAEIKKSKKQSKKEVKPPQQGQ